MIQPLVVQPRADIFGLFARIAIVSIVGIALVWLRDWDWIPLAMSVLPLARLALADLRTTHVDESDHILLAYAAIAACVLRYGWQPTLHLTLFACLWTVGLILFRAAWNSKTRSESLGFADCLVFPIVLALVVASGPLAIKIFVACLFLTLVAFRVFAGQKEHGRVVLPALPGIALSGVIAMVVGAMPALPTLPHFVFINVIPVFAGAMA